MGLWDHLSSWEGVHLKTLIKIIIYPLPVVLSVVCCKRAELSQHGYVWLRSLLHTFILCISPVVTSCVTSTGVNLLCNKECSSERGMLGVAMSLNMAQTGRVHLSNMSCIFCNQNVQVLVPWMHRCLDISDLSNAKWQDYHVLNRKLLLFSGLNLNFEDLDLCFF